MKNIEKNMNNYIDGTLCGNEEKASIAKDNLLKYVESKSEMKDWVNMKLDHLIDCMHNMDWVTAECIKIRILMSIENFVNA